MFSLGIVDKLTPEQETSGRFIAGTGTIDADGKVGPIGGIQQKLIGAKDAGAKVFLSPRSNCAEALPALPLGLSLVPVDSLHDALTVLQKVKNGSALPTCGT